MAFHISDAVKQSAPEPLPTVDDNSPFTFAVHLVLRECNIVVVDVHTTT